MAGQPAQTSQQGMSLGEALTQSQPSSPTQKNPQLARGSIPNKGSISVAFDGKFWEVLYLGSPFSFDTLPEVEGFLEEEGITLQGGWMPEMQGQASF